MVLYFWNHLIFMHIWYWVTSVIGQYANFMLDNNIIRPIYNLIGTI